MSTIFTLSGCLTYTFVIITTIILIVKLVHAFKDGDARSRKAMLFYELFSVLIIGSMLGCLFQSYARSIA